MKVLISFFSQRERRSEKKQFHYISRLPSSFETVREEDDWEKESKRERKNGENDEQTEGSLFYILFKWW